MDPSGSYPKVVGVLSVLGCALVSVATYWIFKKNGGEVVYLWVALLCPLFFGVWLGYSWSGSHPTGYAVSGVALGILETGGVLSVYTERCIEYRAFCSIGICVNPDVVCVINPFGGITLPAEWSEILWRVAFAVTLLFIAGALLPDFLTKVWAAPWREIREELENPDTDLRDVLARLKSEMILFVALIFSAGAGLLSAYFWYSARGFGAFGG